VFLCLSAIDFDFGKASKLLSLKHFGWLYHFGFVMHFVSQKATLFESDFAFVLRFVSQMLWNSKMRLDLAMDSSFL
jgi:hypothetical protein